MATRRRTKILRAIGIVLGVLLVALVVAYFVLDRPRPVGHSRGDQAEMMARAVLDSVRDGAWQRTRIVRFTFHGENHHLWDRTRNYDRYQHGDVDVLLRVSNQTGIAREHGHVVSGKRARELVDQAYAAWVNDSFWLNPLAKMHDEGTTRSVVRGEDGVSRLLISYSSGGLTPGDAYLWTPGRGGAPPTEWRMWAHVLPIGGVRATWERWITLRTGAKVSTLHHVGPFTLAFTGVDGRETVRELGGATDPFREIIEEDIRNLPPEERDPLVDPPPPASQ